MEVRNEPAQVSDTDRSGEHAEACANEQHPGTGFLFTVYEFYSWFSGQRGMRTASVGHRPEGREPVYPENEKRVQYHAPAAEGGEAGHPGLA